MKNGIDRACFTIAAELKIVLDICGELIRLNLLRDPLQLAKGLTAQVSICHQEMVSQKHCCVEANVLTGES